MNLREIRKSGNITQQEASVILGIPLRTYIRYENEEKYLKSFKYQKMCETLEEKFLIDEERGLLTIDKIKEIVKSVFDKYNVEFAFLFGSYAKGYANEKSDVDILIETDITGLGYFGLVEELRQALHKKVDLIRLKDVETGSKFMSEILKVAIKIYG